MVVRGKGTLDFLVKRDLNGAELLHPRMARITWLDRMNYDGLGNEALFAGGVNLDSEVASDTEKGADHTSSGTMRVLFEKPPPAPASRPATP